MEEENKKVHVVVITSSIELGNIWAFEDFEEASEFFISKSSCEYDKEFGSVNEVYEYMGTEDFMDAMHDYIVNFETAVLEVKKRR